ncbi:hypothetical protein AU210_016318 [Fusarium oxysporum f. sp. radicis-cucumerinum]|uniref:Uncharacterized protein n=1 Tax=Fusarium oxysporum f. sp. radicis-cucumerinum TaxID=327505 RepID=A0A2H3GAE4_FUSOX|nr:hypothetical protein AU210_016318 [Fusarium oxysporum f. sp. radicis-cucumerinum]
MTVGEPHYTPLHDPEDGVLRLSDDTFGVFPLKTGDFVLAHGLDGRRTILKVRTDEGKINSVPLAYISYSTCETLSTKSGDEISLSSVKSLQQIAKIAILPLLEDKKNISPDQSVWDDFLVPYLNKRLKGHAPGFHTGDRFTAYGRGQQLRFRVEEILINDGRADYGIITQHTTPQAAAIASSSTNPPAAPDHFDLGIHTPANLNRGARATLLQNGPAVMNSPIGVSPGLGRTAQTPSSPLNAATTAAAAEGAEPNELAREQVEEYNAKLMVFQAFCAKFEEAAQQFTTGPQRRFAQQFADSFLDSWKRQLSSDGTAPKPTYSSVATASPPAARGRQIQQQQQKQQPRQNDPPRRHGRLATTAPLRENLRVFIRLEDGAPARALSSYAIRTLIQEKLGAVSDKVRQIFHVRSGWAVLTADPETRDFLVDKQAEWAAALGATTVETNKEWYTYIASDFPTRLTDHHGREMDIDSIVSHEIEIQTGLKPVSVRSTRQVSNNPLTKTLFVLTKLAGSLINELERKERWPVPTTVYMAKDYRGVRNLIWTGPGDPPSIRCIPGVFWKALPIRNSKGLMEFSSNIRSHFPLFSNT